MGDFSATVGQPSEKPQRCMDKKPIIYEEAGIKGTTPDKEIADSTEPETKNLGSKNANASELPKGELRSGGRLVEEQPQGELQHPHNYWNILCEPTSQTVIKRKLGPSEKGSTAEDKRDAHKRRRDSSVGPLSEDQLERPASL